MKIAVIGSRTYERKLVIKNFIFEAKQKFGKDLEIVSGGAKDGADKYAKKYALEFDCKYTEFNPAHTPMNLYSAMHKNFYGKKYHVSQLFHRNTLIAKYSDVMIGFIDPNSKSAGSNHAIEQMKKLKKPVVIIN